VREWGSKRGVVGWRLYRNPEGCWFLVHCTCFLLLQLTGFPAMLQLTYCCCSFTNVNLDVLLTVQELQLNDVCYVWWSVVCLCVLLSCSMLLCSCVKCSPCHVLLQCFWPCSSDLVLLSCLLCSSSTEVDTLYGWQLLGCTSAHRCH